jgi:hypothetical protein
MKKAIAVAFVAAIALCAPGGPASPQPALADKGCGTFDAPAPILPGIRVAVKISHGDFSCRIARRVMKDLWHNRDVGNWNCIGPQTGYSRCKKAGRGTVIGRLQG